MTSLIDELSGHGAAVPDPRFPHAPEGWTPARAEQLARDEHLSFGEEHWQVLRALQEYFHRHGRDAVRLRALHDALDEAFHRSGGLKHLYQLFPGGPVAQGCRLAGLEAPAGASDRGFGSVA